MKKGFASFPSWPEKVANAWGKSFGGHPIAFMPDPLWLQAFRNAFKVGTVNFANSLSLPSIVKKYAPEVKTAKGLKLCWVKVKGVNNLTWSTIFTTAPTSAIRTWLEPEVDVIALYASSSWLHLCIVVSWGCTQECESCSGLLRSRRAWVPSVLGKPGIDAVSCTQPWNIRWYYFRPVLFFTSVGCLCRRMAWSENWHCDSVMKFVTSIKA